MADSNTNQDDATTKAWRRENDIYTRGVSASLDELEWLLGKISRRRMADRWVDESGDLKYIDPPQFSDDDGTLWTLTPASDETKHDRVMDQLVAKAAMNQAVLTRKAVRWTFWLAIATIVLAGATIVLALSAIDAVLPDGWKWIWE